MSGIEDFLVSEFFFFPLLFIFVVLVCGLLMVFAIMLFWRKVEGAVLDAKVEERLNRKNKVRYCVAISYSYPYKGNEYLGWSGKVFNRLYKERSEADRIAGESRPGTRLAVLVNPIMPEQSVPRRDINPFYIAVLLMAIALSGFWLLVLYMRYHI